MPTYEYRCKDCGEHLEVVQSFNDEPLVTCPACSGSLRKVFGNIGITFKGSGFYRTDNRPGSRKPTESKSDSGSDSSSDSKSESSSGSKSESSSGSKSESKSDSKPATSSSGRSSRSPATSSGSAAAAS